jgi:hypothetical protein
MKSRIVLTWFLASVGAVASVACILLAPAVAEALGPNHDCGQAISSADQCGTTIVVVPTPTAGGQPSDSPKVLGGSGTAMWGES